MKYIFEFQWRNELRRTTSRDKGGGNKLRTYVNFKKTFEYEQYLNIQSTFALRKNITKLRTSSHKLEVEVGRYISKNKKQKTERGKRICKQCDLGEVKDEEHVLMICPKYQSYRKDLLDHLTEAFPPFDQLDTYNKFLFIMQCHDWEATHALSTMLSSIQKVRGSL